VKLSIVVPVLDEARRLPAFLDALARECAGAEVLVADGGSRDGSVDIAARAPGLRLVSSARGRARQMNAGAAAATGDVLLFLHADTRLPAGASDAIRRALGDSRVTHGRFDVRFDNPRAVFRVIAGLMNLRSRATGISTGDQAIFVRRATFARLGGYAEIPLMEDIELTRRLKRVGPQAALRLRVTTSARRWERDGVARTIVFMWTLRFLYLCGADPARLGRRYYGAAPDARPRAGPAAGAGSAAVVLQGAPVRLAPPAPPADPVDTAGEERGRHRQ
jgi:rSAM/selenodomain-associated transferase 2